MNNEIPSKKSFIAQNQELLKKSARPGESWDQVIDRVYEAHVKDLKESIKRNPPAGDDQMDFFVPPLYDVGTRDSRSIMDVAVFRLSKRDRRAGAVIKYDLPDGHVTVSSGPAGMASVWDYDLVLMAISHLTETVNRYRDGRGARPCRVFRPHVSDVLKFCRRPNGGKQKDDLVETCLRLNTTHVAMQRTRKIKGGRTVTVSEGEALISRYKVIKNDLGRAEFLEIELADWMYKEVVNGKNPDVLTVHPDYFLIDPGIGRYIYRLARRAAGATEAKWSFKTIYERSGSTGSFYKFSENLRKIIKANQLPEYSLVEVKGKSGPLLVMQNVEYINKLLEGIGANQDDDEDEGEQD